MGTKVVSLLFCATFVSGLYDGRDGRAIDFGKRTGSRQPFVLSDLTPRDNEVVNTQFSVLGLDILDSLPPVNINQQNFINHQHDVNTKRKHQPRVTISRRPSPGFHAEAQPAVPASNPNAPPVAPVAPPPAVGNPSTGGRNVFNFQPFPNVFNPWRNFYNFANFQPQVTPPPSIERENNRKSRRRQSTTPRTTPPPTTTPLTTTSTTTTTTVAPVESDYDYQYYDFNTNTVDKTDYNHDERKVYTNDDETEDYPYKNDISEYTDDFGNDYDYSDTSVHGCPGSLRECLDACSPVISINNAAYKICVNECLDRC